MLRRLTRLRPEEFPPLDETFTTSEPLRMQIRLGIAGEVGESTDYDAENTRGVVLRIKGDFNGARNAYASALKLDPSRPEAYYNLGLLAEFEANGPETVSEDQQASLRLSVACYERAIQSFNDAAARASDKLHVDAAEQVQIAQKTVDQLDAFLAQLASGG